MAGYTTWAYRALIRQLGGVGLPATEMVHARGFLEETRRGNIPERLWGVCDEPRPLAVQIWDNDPGAMEAIAAELAHRFGVTVIDINFGCPVRRVTLKAKSGSYLLRDPDRVGKLVERVARCCRPVPVTAKIRLGWDSRSINTVEVVRAVQQAGAAAVTIHGRTARQMFTGKADWDAIARVKAQVGSFPVIGNGDLTTAERVAEAFARYGVDGVMIGRAGLQRPWLFRQAAVALAGEPIPPEPSLAEQRKLLLDHYRLVCNRFGPRRGTVLMRRYACCYAQGLPGAKAFRKHVSLAASPEQFIAAVERYFPRNL